MDEVVLFKKEKTAPNEQRKLTATCMKWDVAGGCELNGVTPYEVEAGSQPEMMKEFSRLSKSFPERSCGHTENWPTLHWVYSFFQREM